jgi:hypothetical protein
MGLNKQRLGIRRLSLEQIEATVADHLGRGRVPGNQPGPCFSRQVAMCLAKNVAGWSTTPDRALLQRPASHYRASCHCEDRTSSTDRRSSGRIDRGVDRSVESRQGGSAHPAL